MDEVQVDVDQAVRDLVGGPDLVEQRTCGTSASPQPRGDHRDELGRVVPRFSKWCWRSASKVTASPVRERVVLAVDHERQLTRQEQRGLAGARLVQRRVADGLPWTRPARARAVRRPPAGPAAAASAPGGGGPHARAPVPRPRGRRRRARPRRDEAAARGVRSSPAAIRPATASVGLVSPRSTWDSIGAETPLRSARSRSERPIESRRALTLVPTAPFSVATALTARTLSRTDVTTTPIITTIVPRGGV